MQTTPPLVADVMGAGSPVVLLHGQPGSAGDWGSVTSSLASDHLIIAPDRLGYGRTGGKAAGFAANASSVHQLISRYSSSPAVVVGHSWGGGVALSLALEFPQSVKGLVLVSSVSPLQPVGLFDRVLASHPVGSIAGSLSFAFIGRALGSRHARDFVSRQLKGHDDESLAHLALIWKARSTWRSFATEQRSLVEELPNLGPLSEIRCPVLVTCGNQDRVIGVSATRKLAQAIPEAELKLISDAGHLLPQERPNALADLIQNFASTF